MNFFDAENLCKACEGSWLHKPNSLFNVTGVGIDTREDLTGKVFIAIKGDKHNGHDHLQAALDAHASMIIVQSDVEPEIKTSQAAIVKVDDTRKALARLATAYRQTLTKTMVVAITGSSGKTTTKRLIDSVLKTVATGMAAPKSFNNDIGVPLTILQASPDDDYLIVEIGANNPGEIDSLGEITKPDIAVITSIGRAHLEGFGSIDNIAKEKASLLKHLQQDHMAVIIADSPILREYISEDKTVIWFGQADDAHLRLTDRGYANDQSWFEINNKDRFVLGLDGKHNALNAMAAIAVARKVGLTDEQINTGLAGCRPADMRMTRCVVGNVTVFNDSYNANPDSMIASLNTFKELTKNSQRRVVVLGEMLELGSQTSQLHQEVIDALIEVDKHDEVDHALLIGDAWLDSVEDLRKAWGEHRVMWSSVLDDEIATVEAKRISIGDAVLLKGSRAVGVERVLDAISQRFASSIAEPAPQP